MRVSMERSQLRTGDPDRNEQERRPGCRARIDTAVTGSGTR